MRYVYKILANNHIEGTLQVQLSCVDVPHTGVHWIKYPTKQGIPSFEKADLTAEVLRYFRGDIDSWELWENNRYDVEEIKKEADAVVGNKETFDHSILDDDWLEDELDNL